MAPHATLAVVAAAAALAGAAAQRGAASSQSELLSHIPPPAENIFTTAVFPTEYPSSGGLPNFVSGELTTIVCGFFNGGDFPVNISGIIGSLNDPTDFGTYFMNFTGMFVGEVVEPGNELAMHYSFAPRMPNRQDIDLQLALTVFYNSDREGFATTFYNQTVRFTQPEIAITGSSALAGALWLISAAVGVWIAWDGIVSVPPAIAELFRKYVLRSGGRRRDGRGVGPTLTAADLATGDESWGSSVVAAPRSEGAPRSAKRGKRE